MDKIYFVLYSEASQTFITSGLKWDGYYGVCFELKGARFFNKESDADEILKSCEDIRQQYKLLKVEMKLILQ